MGVHFEVAVAAQVEVHRGMLGEQGEHVVEKGDAGVDFGFALAVEIKRDGNLGFERVAFDSGLPFHGGD